MPSHSIDAAIIGGGIAGLWALNLLNAKGYNAVLLEAQDLGAQQTLASQGMIHGGLKYALSGALTGASEAIARMPARWRACLEGNDDVDLRGCEQLNQDYYMFANDSTRGRLTTFFASKALRGRIDRLPPADWPSEFDGFDGVVYRLNDFVVHTPSLLTTLSHPVQDRILQLRVDPGVITAGDGGGYNITLEDLELHANRLICCAGTGTEALIALLGIQNLAVQHRPLKQVIVKPKHDVPMYAHCLTNISRNEPRLTITSHRVNGQMIWYLGGQLAESGIGRSDTDQIQHAQQELQACVPWLDWQDAEYDVLTVNRAEPAQGGGLRPDEAYVVSRGDCVICFPTKLTLAPDLGDQLLAALPEPAYPVPANTQHPRATLGISPW